MYQFWSMIKTLENSSVFQWVEFCIKGGDPVSNYSLKLAYGTKAWSRLIPNYFLTLISYLELGYQKTFEFDDFFLLEKLKKNTTQNRTHGRTLV